MVLNLLDGFVQTSQYIASKFPGGEVQLVFSDEFYRLMGDEDSSRHKIQVHIRANSSDNIILLCLATRKIHREWPDTKIIVHLHYMPYQQSDRVFEDDNGKRKECFGLEMVTCILNDLPVYKYVVTDAHSDVTVALLKKCVPDDNSEFIIGVLRELSFSMGDLNNLTILTPDAGAYKKIFKLCTKIKFGGVIECANKFRAADGNLYLHLSTSDFLGRDVLVIDDICVGGRTFTELANEISSRNIGHIYLAVTHGILSNGLDELKKRYHRIFTTNSWQDENSLKKMDGGKGGDWRDFLRCHPVF